MDWWSAVGSSALLERPYRRSYRQFGKTAYTGWIPSTPHSAFGPNHDPSRLDRDRGRRRNRLLRCHHDRHEHGRLVRRQRQLAAPRRLAPGKEMLRADLMPARHLRRDRARRKRFRDDPLLVRVTPPSPATNATANLDAPSRRGSVNYMVPEGVWPHPPHPTIGLVDRHCGVLCQIVLDQHSLIAREPAMPGIRLMHFTRAATDLARVANRLPDASQNDAREAARRELRWMRSAR